MVYFKDGKYGSFVIYTNYRSGKYKNRKYCYRQIGSRTVRVYLIPTGNPGEWQEE